MNLAVSRWILWLVYLVAWSAALLTPFPDVLADATLPAPTHFRAAKTLHVAAYALLTVLTGWLRLPAPYRWYMLLLISAHAFGTEFLQQFVPLRGPSLRDVGLDHLGLLLGVFLSWPWWWSGRSEALADPG